MKKHEVIVPFDKKMRVRYMFAKNGDDQEVAIKISRLERICNESEIKKEKVLEICRSVVENGEKIAVLTKYAQITRSLFDCFVENGLKENIMILTYRMRSSGEINELIQKINDEKSKEKIIFITDASMVGMSLSGVNHLLHYDYPNSPSVLKQRESCIGRIRPGEYENNIYYVMTEGGVDQMLYKQVKSIERAIEDLTT